MKGTSVMWDYIREEQEALGRMLDDEALFETAGSVPELEAVYNCSPWQFLQCIGRNVGFPVTIYACPGIWVYACKFHA